MKNYKADELMPEEMAKLMFKSIKDDYKSMKESPLSWKEFISSRKKKQRDNNYVEKTKKHLDNLLFLSTHSKIRKEYLDMKQNDNVTEEEIEDSLYRKITSLTTTMVKDLSNNYGLDRNMVLKNRQLPSQKAKAKLVERLDYI